MLGAQKRVLGTRSSRRRRRALLANSIKVPLVLASSKGRRRYQAFHQKAAGVRQPRHAGQKKEGGTAGHIQLLTSDGLPHHNNRRRVI